MILNGLQSEFSFIIYKKSIIKFNHIKKFWIRWLESDVELDYIELIFFGRKFLLVSKIKIFFIFKIIFKLMRN